jgi:general secretion pathway protein D
VPGLGKVPVLGGLFRSRQATQQRQTLFVFLRPTILRNRGDVATVSENRFLRLRAIEAEPEPKQGPLARTRKAVPRLPLEINGLY